MWLVQRLQLQVQHFKTTNRESQYNFLKNIQRDSLKCITIITFNASQPQ